MPVPDLDRYHQAVASATADFNQTVRPLAEDYRRALDRLVEAEALFLLDLTSEPLGERSKAARKEYDKARKALDNSRRGALGARTKAIEAAWEEASA